MDVRKRMSTPDEGVRGYTITIRAYIRLKKRFRYIAVPEVITPAIRIGMRKHKKLAITTDKPEIKRFVRPQNADLCFL